MWLAALTFVSFCVTYVPAPSKPVGYFYSNSTER